MAQRGRNPGRALGRRLRLVCHSRGTRLRGSASLGVPAGEGQLCPEGGQRSAATPSTYSADLMKIIVAERVKFNTLRHGSKFYGYRIPFLRNVTNLPKTQHTDTHTHTLLKCTPQPPAFTGGPDTAQLPWRFDTCCLGSSLDYVSVTTRAHQPAHHGSS